MSILHIGLSNLADQLLAFTFYLYLLHFIYILFIFITFYLYFIYIYYILFIFIFTFILVYISEE